MRKEKSKVVLSIFIVAVSICLILNIYFEKRESNCLIGLETLRNNLTIQRFDNVHAQLNWIFLHYNLMQRNLSYLDLGAKECTFKSIVDPIAQNITEGVYDDIGEVQRRIRTKEGEIKTKRNECNHLSFKSSIFISLAFMINLIAFVYAILIYRLYKT